MKVDRERAISQLEELKGSGYSYLKGITAVDRGESISVIYFLHDMRKGDEETVEVELAPHDAWVHSAVKVYRSADWYERELQEMFGIEIRGRRCERLLLERLDWVSAPMRRNFEWKEEDGT